MKQPGPILLPLGFKFSAVTAGIKASRKPDLALILALPRTTAAALFTTNLVKAAPVEAGREALARSRGRIRAVIVNSGNANCATGLAGLRACHSVCQKAARLLNIRASEIFPSSTGVIGVPLPAQKIIAKLPALISAAAASADHPPHLPHALPTTDSPPKPANLAA